MQFEPTELEGVMRIINRKYGDERGFFMETYHKERFVEAGIDVEFLQANHSSSEKGVLRGLHLQCPSWQGKLVRCLEGEVFDVAVDIRPQSPQFGQWIGQILSSENLVQLYIPEGYAHGFVVLSDVAQVAYKCTGFYKPEDEVSIKWDDEDIGIEWPIIPKNSQLSQKDKEAISLEEWRQRYPDGIEMP